MAHVSDARDDRTHGLLAWQWGIYPDGHRDRTNLAIHVVTAPLFWLGTLALLAPLAGPPWWTPIAGALVMALAVGAQGRGHKREATTPVPFRSPLDAVARLFVEQWVTFPRFLFGGGLIRAWRAAR